MLEVPHTYAQWSSILEALETQTDDSEVLRVMQAGSLVWQSGVAERFVQRLVGAINCRMNKATDRFQRELRQASGQEGRIIQALLQLRRELHFLAAAINLPVLPEADRQRYLALVVDQAQKMQQSLENSARHDRSGKLASIVRNHRLTNI